jgi:tetratricopeptide (TPR) repeat protein
VRGPRGRYDGRTVTPSLAPNPSPDFRRALKQVVRRRVLGSSVRALGRHASLALFAAGAAVLVLRTLDPHAAAPWGWIAAAPLVGALSAFAAGRRSRPTSEAAAAWLDVHGGASGEVVTEAELGASDWSRHAAQRIERALAALPRAPWTAALRKALPAAAFALAALWVPLPELPVGPPPFVAGHALERVEEKLEALDEQLELEPELAEELRERLERVQEAAEEQRYDATFEALDRLEERLDSEAQEALEAAERAADELAAAATDPHLDHAQEALEAALKEMRDAGLTKGLSEEARAALGERLELPPGLQLSSQELAKLARELSGAMGAKLAKLDAARAIDPARLAKLMQARLDELGELGEAGEFDPDHVCDEKCKQPGGT